MEFICTKIGWGGEWWGGGWWGRWRLAMGVFIGDNMNMLSVFMGGRGVLAKKRQTFGF